MRALTSAVLFSLLACNPVSAEVTASSDTGFAIERSVTVPANAVTTWAALLRPAEWWQSAHTWSGSAANLSLDVRAGGCFCEVLPQAKDMTARGMAEHMRVIQAAPGRMLRMSGALGPMQGEAAQGTMTISLTPTASGTTIKFEYIVSGYLRMGSKAIAPAVDGVLGAQLRGLATRLGAPPVVTAPPKP